MTKALVAVVVCLGAGAAAVAIASTGGDDSTGDGRKPAGSAAAQKSAIVWAVGDGADGGSDANSVVNLIRESDPDRLLYLGDVYEYGTAEEFRDNYEPSWGKLAKITSPTPGNHDWPNHAEGYDPYWKDVRGKPLPYWYSLREGGWKILSLNSEANHSESSPQVRWLKRALRGPGDCRIAFWHRPRYNAGLHGDQPDVQPLWKPLAGHARIALWGHDHNMQRLKSRAGIVQFVSGAGGHQRYPLVPMDQRVAFGSATQPGALRLDLRPGRAHYRFISTSGKTLDSGTIRCRRS